MDDAHIAGGVVAGGPNGRALALIALMADKQDTGILGGQTLQHLAAAVGTAIVDDDDFEPRDGRARQPEQTAHAGRDQVPLVVDRDDDGEGEGLSAELLGGGQRSQQMRGRRLPTRGEGDWR